MPGRIKVIGLTGGIATGKSSIARFFSTQGIPVIDADQISRDAVLPGTPALDQITQLFGCQVLTKEGLLNRTRLSEMVFSDGDKRRLLENILHPEIRRISEKLIAEAAAAGHRWLIYMAPLLIEAGATDRVDDIWVVTVRPEIQLERLMRRDGISREKAEQIIASQMPLVEKERYGSVVIDNSGSEAETLLFLEDAWKNEVRSRND